MAKRRGNPCRPGCVSYCDLPVGSYFQYCGTRAMNAPTRSAYKKTAKSKTARGRKYSGGSVEMLLKERMERMGLHKRAPFYGVKGCPCVKKVSREFAIAAAERHLRRKLGMSGRARRAA